MINNTRNTSDLKRNVLSFVVLVVFLFLAAGSIDTDRDTQKVKNQTFAYALSANQLCKEYSSNEVAADFRYKGKIVVVFGTIQRIGKDIMDQAYIVIGGEGFLDSVQCMFTTSEDASVARLSKGQFVKVKGEVSGKIIGNVLLDKCSLQ